ncbi:GNAT family N-acetyltransferase [Maritalea porphyrae]|uniref:N-acetyltransferase domain-containing protein n=1 Tax=Maritalea porphyrae TaxID=880732 RepID=A0ABQ5ULF3_9HYPH|nr:GNAT family N-acetyltransferase [Maritalea porphyrae]GLQ16110.1 hypothetical protein GCM10007879_03590 [Maritalea porphyrae]
MNQIEFALEKVASHHCAALLLFERENADYFSQFVPPRALEMLTDQGMARAIEALKTDMLEREGLYFVAVIGDEIVGRINFTIGGDQAEIGYRLAERWTGKGLAGQLLETAIAALCKEYHIKRLIARVITSNLASTKVVERAGFERFNTEEGGGERRGFGGDLVSFERWLD